MKAITIKVLLAAALLVPFAANAVPISGDIGIGGALLPTCGGTTASCGMDVADGLTFTSDGLVLFASGDFGGIGFGTTVTMMDFAFNPFTGVDNPLWSVGGFQFALDDVVIVGQTSTGLMLSGTGEISSAGFDATMGAWSFSADIVSMTSNFSWSSTTLASPTAAPEPGILVLIGMGLIGGLGARRLTRS